MCREGVFIFRGLAHVKLAYGCANARNFPARWAAQWAGLGVWALKPLRNMAEYDAIIIGSGAGGLAAAICLARAGQRVLVQHYVPGGWCHSFYLDGHRFSPGVHYRGLLGPGQGTRQLYEGLGIANDLTFLRMNPAVCEHCWISDERWTCWPTSGSCMSSWRPGSRTSARGCAST